VWKIKKSFGKKCQNWRKNAQRKKKYVRAEKEFWTIQNIRSEQKVENEKEKLKLWIKSKGKKSLTLISKCQIWEMPKMSRLEELVKTTLIGISEQ